MKILVTGAAGFIGSQTSKALIANGHEVVGLDNINNYYSTSLKEARLKDVASFEAAVGRSGAFRFIKGDIADYGGIAQIFEAEKFDKVCNLAAQAGVRYSFERPDTYIQSNLVGFFNVLDNCVKHKVQHLVYASSSSVYGNNEKTPFGENDRVDAPQSLYAATKKADELMAYVYTRQMGLPTTGLRFFTVYGPWGRPDMAPYGFMKKILESSEIQVFNNGDLSRDFSYVDDIVRGVVAVLEGPCVSKNPVYNIGNGSPVKLMDFIETIEKVTEHKAVMKMVGMQKGDVYTTYADCSLLEKDYGFRPNTPLLHGITQMYQWYKKISTFVTN